jgi:hypothetical protein
LSIVWWINWKAVVSTLLSRVWREYLYCRWILVEEHLDRLETTKKVLIMREWVNGSLCYDFSMRFNLGTVMLISGRCEGQPDRWSPPAPRHWV